MKKLYIAYGSDMSTENMRKKCPGARVIAKSWLHDYQLAFHGLLNAARVTVVPSEGSDVPVIIWEISEHDEEVLDVFEGARVCLRKKETMVVEVDGKMEEALIYVQPPRPVGRPHDSHLRSIAHGYREFNLDIRILNQAVLRSYAQTQVKYAQ